jgi:hypothetical protein
MEDASELDVADMAGWLEVQLPDVFPSNLTSLTSLAPFTHYL